ncbi:MAG: hypothetical protein ACREBQ_08240 [Nitrososphaerales archaeon]
MISQLFNAMRFAIPTSTPRLVWTLPGELRQLSAYKAKKGGAG